MKKREPQTCCIHHPWKKKGSEKWSGSREINARRVYKKDPRKNVHPGGPKKVQKASSRRLFFIRGRSLLLFTLGHTYDYL